MKAKVMSSSVCYLLEGRDDSGLIPEGAESALVQYEPNGEVRTVWYCKNPPRDADMDQLRAYQKEIDQMNSGDKSQDYKNTVVGLLKKLASQ